MRLSTIIGKPQNRQLFIDFPHLRQAYANVDAAKQTVRERQKSMRDEPTYAALAVVVGSSLSTSTVCGVTSMNVTQIPGFRNHHEGIHTAVWLDPSRPYKGIGAQLMRERISWLVRRGEFNGPLWTVIRPSNRGSWPVWTEADLPLTFERVGKPASYSQVDGQTTPRQLFVSTQPIEALRRGSRRKFR